MRVTRPRGGRRAPRALTGIVAVAALTLLSACGSGDPAPSPSPSPSPTATPTPTPTPSPTPTPTAWPLTGVSTTAYVDRPALAVKVENSSAGRPQAGIAAADIVWEEVVEGGITRFVVVFHSTLPPEVGPVRSVRPMDPAITAPLHGLVAFSGGQSAFVQAISAAGLQAISFDAGAAGFARTKARKAPHNVMGTPQALLDQADADHRAAPPAQFGYAPAGEAASAAATGAPAAGIALRISGSSKPRWTWSASDGAWLRSEGTKDAVDAAGTRLRATNVVVLRVDVKNTKYRDAAGSAVPETILTGASGDAMVAAGGKTLAARWAKAGVGDPVVLTTADGAPVLLAPGTTWVELVPNGTGSVATS